MEIFELVWADQTANDDLCDQQTTVTASNFNVVPNASGVYTGTKPTIYIDCSDHEQIPSGLSWTFDIGGDNWPTSMTVVAYFQNGTTATIGGFTPQAPTVYDTFTYNKQLSSIRCTINSAHKGGEPLKFTAFHFGKCFSFKSDAIKSMTIQQSADFSGCSAPYSTLNATVYGRGAGEMIGYNAKMIVKSSLKNRIGVFYVKSLKSTYNTTGYDKRDYFTFSAVSALGLLAEQEYQGYYGMGVIYGGQVAGPSMKMVVQDISSYSTDFSALSAQWMLPFNGLIEQGLSRRDALARCANAIGLWVDADANLRALSSASTITIPAERVFAFPVVSPNDVPQSIDIHGYFIYEAGSTKRTNSMYVNSGGIDYEVLDSHNSFTINTGKADPVTISGNYAAYRAYDGLTPSSGADWSELRWFNRKVALVTHYSRPKTWKGRVLWNTSTNECRIGQRVTVPTNSGRTFTGYVKSSTLKFSGASVVAELEVLGDLN